MSCGSNPRNPIMFRKILFANRGGNRHASFAAVAELNIATAAIYSETDSSGIYAKRPMSLIS